MFYNCNSLVVKINLNNKTTYFVVKLCDVKKNNFNRYIHLISGVSTIMHTKLNITVKIRCFKFNSY